METRWLLSGGAEAVLPVPDEWLSGQPEGVLSVSVSPLAEGEDVPMGILVEPTGNLVTTEGGGTATFAVCLTAQPAAEVTVEVTSTDATEGQVPLAALTFSPADWNQSQIVTVTGVNDDERDGPIPYTIELTTAAGEDGQGYARQEVAVTNLDDDTPGITVGAPTYLMTTKTGGTASFTVVLDSLPTAPVTVRITSSDPSQGTLSAEQLVFQATPGGAFAPQTVTVTGKDDAGLAGRVQYQLNFSVTSGDPEYQGLAPASLAVQNLDASSVTRYTFNNTVARVGLLGFLAPPSVVLRGTSIVDVEFEGSKGAARDDNGNGRDEVAAQLSELQMAGAANWIGPLQVRLAALPSFGVVEEQANAKHGVLELPPFAPGSAAAYFDLFLEVDTLQGRLTNRQPARIQGVVTQATGGVNNVFQLVNGPITLWNQAGRASGYLIGSLEIVPNAMLGSMEGQNWQDGNANGVRDPGEPGLDDWAVALLNRDTGQMQGIQVTQSADLNGDGQVDPETEQGRYRFEDVPAGNWILVELGRAGWGRTVPGFSPPLPASLVGPGPHWLGSVPAASDDSAQYAVADFDWNLDGQVDEQATLSGSLQVRLDAPQDDGSGGSLVSAEIQQLTLSGRSAGRQLQLSVGDGGTSAVGEIRELASDPQLAYGAFDLNFRLQATELQVGPQSGQPPYEEVWTNAQSLHITALVDRFPFDGVLWESQGGVSLLDGTGQIRGRLLRLRTAYQSFEEGGGGPVYQLALGWGEQVQHLDFANVDLGTPRTTGQDYGDAPAPYPTTLASNGASHALDGVTFLGLQVDAEEDGQPTNDADGDDRHGTAISDEEGIWFVTPLVLGQEAAILVTSSTPISDITGDPLPGYLNAWIDFNADGDWDDPGERIFTDQQVTSGQTRLTFTVPSLDAGGVLTAHSYARFRFTAHDPQGTLSYAGPAENGEVEDYPVAIDHQPVTATAGDWTIGVTPTNYQGFRDPQGRIVPVGLNVWRGPAAGQEADHLQQQWFWYRLGDSSRESPLQTLPLTSVTADENSGTIVLTYGRSVDPFSATITYVLTSAGAQQSTIAESVTLTNHQDAPLDLHWFEYTDLDVDPRWGDNTARWIASGHVEQRSAVLSTVDARVTSGPAPNHWEMASAGTLAARLNDGVVTDLSDGPTFLGPDNVAHAFQWDLQLAPHADTTLLTTESGQFAEVVLPHPGGFSFDVPVLGRRWFDPAIAMGYDYAVAGGPTFASVTLPMAVGDNQYELYLPDEQGGYLAAPISLVGGVTYPFAVPVSRFRVLGIEVDAALDAADTAAFPTELAFSQSAGEAAVTMTPIPATIYVDAYGQLLEEVNYGTTLGQVELGDLVTWQPGTPDEVRGLTSGTTAFSSLSAAQAYVAERHLSGLTSLRQASPAEIHGYAFADRNGNGQDDGEPRSAGIRIQLLDSQGVVVRTAQTDAAGRYSFENLGVGRYTLNEDPPEITVTTKLPLQLTLTAGQVFVATAGLGGAFETGQTELVTADLAIGNRSLQENAFFVSFGSIALDFGATQELVTLIGRSKSLVFFEGSQPGGARDADGNGKDEVVAYLTALELSGRSSRGVIRVRLDTSGISSGMIRESLNAVANTLDLAPFGNLGGGRGVFDTSVLVEIDGTVYHPTAPLHLEALLTQQPPGTDEAYQHHARVSLLDGAEEPSGTSITSLRLTPNPQHAWQNPILRMDVNNDGSATPLDVLLVINYLNTYGSTDLPVPPPEALTPPLFVDSNGDNGASPIDVLLIISHLNQGASGEGESGAASRRLPGPGGNAMIMAEPAVGSWGSSTPPSGAPGFSVIETRDQFHQRAARLPNAAFDLPMWADRTKDGGEGGRDAKRMRFRDAILADSRALDDLNGEEIESAISLLGRDVRQAWFTPPAR